MHSTVIGRRVVCQSRLFLFCGERESMQEKLRLAVVYPWSSDFIWTKSVHSMLQLKHPENVEIAWGRGGGW